jgi:hypothetical protein
MMAFTLSFGGGDRLIILENGSKKTYRSGSWSLLFILELGHVLKKDPAWLASVLSSRYLKYDLLLLLIFARSVILGKEMLEVIHHSNMDTNPAVCG